VPRRSPLVVLSLTVALSLPATARADPAASSSSGFLGGGGVLPHRVHAIFVNADTELSGYPAGFLGWRVGLGGFSDVGLELGGDDKAFLGRLHGKLRVLESASRRWFVGARLRVELKRHKQDFGSVFRPIDDFGFAFVPELSLGVRLGARRRQVLYYETFYYLNVDVRRDYPPTHYVMPGLIGYEARLWRGLHLGVEAGVFFEVAQPATAGEPLIKAGLTLGWVFL
jgi:hypothetical protein